MKEPNIEKFKYGQFGLTPEEREKAKKEGRLKELEKKMAKATNLLRLKQRQEALESLKEEAKKTIKEEK